MLAYLKGELGAFEVLVRRHRRPVFNFILRYLGDPEQAEDLVQETFLRLANNASAYRKRSKLTTWLYTIARNLCIDAHRKAKHRRHLSLDQPSATLEDGEGENLGERLPDASAGTDRSAASARLAPLLRAAIAQLPEEQREVFVLREYSGVPFKEIGRITDTPPNTVKSRMRYALEGLRIFLLARGVSGEDAHFDAEGAGGAQACGQGRSEAPQAPQASGLRSGEVK